MFEQLMLDLTPRYGAGEARSIAHIVFEDAFGTRRQAEKVLSPDEALRFEEIRRRLLSGEPVQYVLGQADFFGLKFAVTPAVLIPRQETEELVAWVLDWLKKQSIVFPQILDIGLGSGCIAVALKHKRREIQVFGLEKSPEALAVATENARNLLGNGAFTFFQGDILAPDTHPNLPPLDVVVSNPPYIAWQERDLMPEHVLAHEPEMALFVADDDPLLFYRAIGFFAQKNLAPGGALFLECNEFNAKQVADLLAQIGFDRIELRQDMSGADRMVLGCV